MFHVTKSCELRLLDTWTGNDLFVSNSIEPFATTIKKTVIKIYGYYCDKADPSKETNKPRYPINQRVNNQWGSVVGALKSGC